MAAGTKTPVTQGGGAVDAPALERRRGRCLSRPGEDHDPGRRWPRTADLRHGCDHEPPADLGPRAQASGRHVPRGQGDRRPRRAARLFPGLERDAGEQMGRRSGGAGPADGVGVLPGRLHADPQGAHPRAPRKQASQGQCRRLCRRLHGGGHRRAWRPRRRARAARRADVPVPGGAGATAERAFKEIARLTRGAYCHFDAGSAGQLRALLAAVAVYATGGRKALQGLRRGDQERRRAAASRTTSCDR